MESVTVRPPHPLSECYAPPPGVVSTEEQPSNGAVRYAEPRREEERKATLFFETSKENVNGKPGCEFSGQPSITFETSFAPTQERDGIRETLSRPQRRLFHVNTSVRLGLSLGA